MPLSVDMPLENLKEYKGCSPKPKDFDEYWKEALKELDEIPINLKIEKNSFETPYCECYDLYFEGINKAIIHAKYLKPKGIKPEEKIPAILEFHGYGGCSKDWTYKLPYVACKIAVFSMDCRGQLGESTDDFGAENSFRSCNLTRGILSPKELYYKKVFLDGVRLSKIVMDFDFIDEKRVGAMGYSQGGGISLAISALNSEIKSVFVVYPFLSDYYRCWNIDTGAAYEDIKEFLRKKDPQHKRENEIFNNLGYVDIQNMAHLIKADVTMTTGLMDKVCPPSTQFATYNKLVCEKNHLIFHDYGHEDMLVGLQDENILWALKLLKK